MSMTDNSTNPSTNSGSNLLEENYISYGAQYGGPHLITGASGSGLTVHTDSNIVRYCSFFGNVEFGIRIGSSIAQATGRNNHVYNNTVFYSGYNMDSWGVVREDDIYLLDNLRCAILIYQSSCDGSVENNVIKNNLAHNIWSETNNWSGDSYYPSYYALGTSASCNSIINNWGTVGEAQSEPFTPWSNPIFIDTNITNPMAFIFTNGVWAGSPDLSLSKESPCIDSATYLTVSDGVGSASTTLIVDDSRYFQDGTWGSDLARSTFHADWVSVGETNNASEISSINYSTNTITLISPLSWNNNSPVRLYKKSDGERVLYGTETDFGAFEYMYGKKKCSGYAR
jgi:hypothetical protein